MLYYISFKANDGARKVYHIVFILFYYYLIRAVVVVAAGIYLTKMHKTHSITMYFMHFCQVS
jgi:hypothetical protein